MIPDLVRRHPPDRPLRIWVAGCSTGEETYSLAMLLIEEITAAKRSIKLQFFASDVDEDAVALAREGRYPGSIAADVSPQRLARFFRQEEHGHRVAPELRGVVVFTVQNVLADPPFSRLDLISCRNLLIYLRPEAQQKVLLLFHFALSEGGILLLGSSETVGSLDDRFEPISKTQRVYRQIGRSRPGEVDFPIGTGAGARAIWPGAPHPAAARRISASDLTHRLLVETYAPASVLINRKYECLYYSGPTDRYLKVATGEPSRDLLAMAREGLRNKLRAAVQQASREHAHTTATGAEASYGGSALAVRIEVHPVQRDGEELLLVSFFDEPVRELGRDRAVEPADHPLRIAELERELETTRKELESAIHDLEIANEEQKAINQEAMSANEEFSRLTKRLMTSRKSCNRSMKNLQRSTASCRKRSNASAAHPMICRTFWTAPGWRPCSWTTSLIFGSLHRRPNRCFVLSPPTSDGRSPISPARRRPRSPHRRPRGAHQLCTGRTRGRNRRRRLVRPPHSALSHPGQSDRRGGHHLRRHFRDQGGGARDQAARAYSDSIIDTIRQPLVVLDEELRVVYYSRSFYRSFALTREETVGKPLGFVENGDPGRPGLLPGDPDQVKIGAAGSG